MLPYEAMNLLLNHNFICTVVLHSHLVNLHYNKLLGTFPTIFFTVVNATSTAKRVASGDDGLPQSE